MRNLILLFVFVLISSLVTAQSDWVVGMTGGITQTKNLNTSIQIEKWKLAYCQDNPSQIISFGIQYEQEELWLQFGAMLDITEKLYLGLKSDLNTKTFRTGLVIRFQQPISDWWFLKVEGDYLLSFSQAPSRANASIGVNYLF